MLIEVTRQDLINLVKSSEPNPNDYGHALFRIAGHSYDEEAKKSTWFNLNKLTDEGLHSLYLICNQTSLELNGTTPLVKSNPNLKEKSDEELRIKDLNQLYLLTNLIIIKMEDLETKRFPRMQLKSIANKYKKHLKIYIEGIVDNSKETDIDYYKKQANLVHLALEKIEDFLDDLYFENE